MPIEVVKEGFCSKWATYMLHCGHRAAHTIAHPRTGAAVEVIYAGHSLLHADGAISIAIYVALAIVAMAHFIWVHMD